MKFPVTTTESHEGKVLEMNADQEVVTLHSATGKLLGTLSWGVVIEQILASDDDVRFAHARSYPRAPLAVKVRYTTPEGKQFDSLTGGIGAGGLFIESSTPLAPGTELSVEFALPDRPWEKHKAKAKVAWTRNKPERHLLFPGMGVQFTEHRRKGPQRACRTCRCIESFPRISLRSPLRPAAHPTVRILRGRHLSAALVSGSLSSSQPIGRFCPHPRRGIFSETLSEPRGDRRPSPFTHRRYNALTNLRIGIMPCCDKRRNRLA